ncbi:hypothetical protein N7470_010396 [Penicillium chermesinum]|nr:hypothetical protein N7470_010396 [Penicillium chermesinum]
MSPLSYLPPLPQFLFSTLFVSGLAAKILHIGLHFHSLPFLYLALYSPTLFLPDFLVITCGRILLRFPTPETRLQWLSTCIGGLLSLITWGAASIQFGFFLQTGAEVAWAASNSFLSDPAAMKILLSGITTVSAASTVLGFAAWAIYGRLYNVTGLALQGVQDSVMGLFKARYTLIGQPSKSWLATFDLRTMRRIAIFVSLFTSLLFLQITRPAIPYNHISGALPLTLLDAFTKKSATDQGCREPAPNFPLWNRDKFTPAQWSRPSWLPENPPSGFSRWVKSPLERAEEDNAAYYLCNDAESAFFNPFDDPLKISNLGGEIYEPLAKSLQGSRESGRKELFPIHQGTPMFDALVASHKAHAQKDAIDRLLKITPVAQMLTGETVLDSNGQAIKPDNATKWHDRTADGMGGLNVRGAVTGSSLTFKSILGSHCGVQPLPVDLLEETQLEIYQPCLPQLLELFNRVKSSSELSSEEVDALERPWKSVFMQSITDEYDRQNEMNEQMGFEEHVVKSNLTSMTSKYRASSKEINYFGYAETELRPYLQDLFNEAAHNNTRVFLSHVTSTTHHPWNTPRDFDTQKYLGREGGIKHDAMNSYLNSVNFVDGWLGEIMSMLDESGIANSTLVVIVGDHGQAFAEDNKDLTGTYENGHISNFRVPLVFRHPHMPRIDIDANATSLSIIPTILDMLVQSGSLNDHDSDIASHLLPEYQGQSLIRPFLSSINDTSIEGRESRKHEGNEMPATRYQWNFGIINGGGSMISVTTAGLPYRLVLPLKNEFEYIFSDLDKDPGELHVTKAWSIGALKKAVKEEYGSDAVKWLESAGKVGKWWVRQQRRIWGYREA